MQARNYDTRVYASLLKGLINTPFNGSVKIPCNASLKAVPKGTAFPSVLVKVEGYKTTEISTDGKAVKFYVEKGSTITLTDCELYVDVGLGNWALIGVGE